MSILIALLAGLIAGWAFARGRHDRIRLALVSAVLGAGIAGVVATIAGEEPVAGGALGVLAAAVIARVIGQAASSRWITAVLAGLLLLRLAVALGGGLPLTPDEAQYWDWSRTLDLAYYSKPGGIAWLIHGWTTLTGDSLAALRLLGLALAGLTMVLTWRLARCASGSCASGSSETAWLATLVAACLPIHAAFAGVITTDVPLSLCWAGFLVVLLRTPAGGGTSAWWHGPALGLLLAAGLNAKYAMLYAPLAIAGAACALPQLRCWLRTPAPWVALAIGLAGLLPAMLWNRDHGWIGFLHVAGQGGAGKSFGLHPFFVLDYLAGQLAVGLPASLLLIPACRWAWRQRSERPAPWLLAMAALTPLVVLLAACLQTRVQANWPAMAWIPAAVLVAWWVAEDGRRWPRRTMIAGASLGVVAAILLAALPSIRPLLPDIPPSVPERKLAGWDDLAFAVAQLVEDQPERTVVLTAGYDVAAELAWHNRHLPRPLCANFGRRMNQYDLWDRLGSDHLGQDVIFAMELDRKDALDGDLRSRLPAGLTGDFAGCDQPIVVDVVRGPRTWRRFLVVRLRAFDGVLDSAQPVTTW